jgi:hypothetical protein
VGTSYGTSALRGYAVARSAEAMLRTVGATTVHVIRLAQITGTLGQRELGQAQPQYDDVAIGPAAISVESVPPAAMKIDVLLPARVVARQAEAEGAESGTAWLLSARGILHEGTLLRISKVKADSFAGVEYLYHVTAEV